MSTLASVTFALSALVAAYFLLPYFGISVLPDLFGVTYRYKLTIEIEVDGEIKSGSSVVEVRNYIASGSEGGVRDAVTGEALFLDLGPDRRPLIALLTRQDQPSASAPKSSRGWGFSNPTGVLSRVYGVDRAANEAIESYWARLAKSRGVKELSFSQLPTLVTFSDLGDPSSVMTVDPNELEATLGPGVKWRRATIEISDEPITRGIEERLTWLSSYYDRMLDERRPGQHEDGSFASTLNTGSFLRRGF